MSILTINTSRTGQPSGAAPISPMQVQDFTLVLNKFKVDTWMLESVQAHFNDVLPYLLQGSEYTWQELLGEDFFADVTVPRHLPLLCLKHLAQQPDSQLTAVPLTGCDTTYFEIR